MSTYIANLLEDRISNDVASGRPIIGAFDINKVAGKVLWLKADTDLFSDVAGNVPSVDGGKVCRWNDQSEQDNDCFNIYPPAQPTLKANGLNGHNTVVFAKASNNGLVANNADKFNIDYPTVFIVAKGSGTGDFFGKGDGNFGDARHRKLSIVPFSGGTNFSYWAGTDAMSGCSANATIANFNIIGIRSRHNKDTVLSVNGAETLQTFQINNTYFNSKQFCIGFGFVAGFEYMDCEIAELILFKRILTDDENKNVVDYLSAKYAISVSNTVPAVLPDRSVADSRDAVV